MHFHSRFHHLSSLHPLSTTSMKKNDWLPARADLWALAVTGNATLMELGLCGKTKQFPSRHALQAAATRFTRAPLTRMQFYQMGTHSLCLSRPTKNKAGPSAAAGAVPARAASRSSPAVNGAPSNQVCSRAGSPSSLIPFVLVVLSLPSPVAGRTFALRVPASLAWMLASARDSCV